MDKNKTRSELQPTLQKRGTRNPPWDQSTTTAVVSILQQLVAIMRGASAVRAAVVLLVATVDAWIPHSTQRSLISTSSSQLFNVPPPAEEDVVAFTKFASKQSPPASFFELQQDAIRATRLACQDGHKLLEIEFPPLPANVLEMIDVSAYDVTEANLNLAVEFAKGMLLATENKGTNKLKKIAILVPDEAELNIAIDKVGTSNPYPGVIISSLRKSDPNDDRIVKPEQLLLSLFGSGSSGVVKAIDDVDMYICLTASAQELPDIEELHQRDPDKTIVFYNLKLDILRGDLGAPAFPGRDFQDRFLSKVKPGEFDCCILTCRNEVAKHNLTIGLSSLRQKRTIYARDSILAVPRSLPF